MQSLVAESNERLVRGERLNFVSSGKRFRSNFIEPGVVDYSDVGCGIELLRRETIEKALNTAIGNPLTKGHISTRINSFAGIAHGTVDKVGYDEASRMYFAEGNVDTDEGRAMIKDGKQPSCGYRVLSFGPGGRYNNVPYEREITEIVFHHLAIVDNPRYQEADIRLNSKPNPVMNPLKWIAKKILPASEAGGTPKTEEVSGEIAADASIEIGGKPVRLNELVAARLKADAEADARENALNGDTRIEYAPGKFATVTELTQSYRANEKSDKDEDESDEAKAKKAERDNAIAQDEKKKADEKRENAASFRVLQNAKTTPPPVRERANSAGTLEEKAAIGKARYGSAVANGKN